MQNFKVGDWVKSTKYPHLKPIQIESTYESNERKGELGLKSQRTILYSSEVVHWQPTEGEWVIPDSGLSDDMFVVMKYDPIRLIANRCEPFMGQLPSNLKDNT